ncbi:S-layer homology domain-containing protein [Paenibacillus pini]|uniref:Flagellar hook-length control protein FliK n=1 Tax=Paenibacillus pini JCM 16418 TaxID=1236976 RepID=W7YDH6_9BACL|nr:S-layer homology domain-containing protein [Paenibacillus pini]GAF08990.1 flagellar hook-length control protein FliK [Paenibacillus pini JCM 16418]
MLRKSLIIALFCTLCSSTWLASAHAETASDFKMKASSEESSDSTFTITLKGSGIKDLYAYELKFKLDPSELEVVKAETKIKGYSVSPISKNGEITIAHTKIGNVDGEKGDLDIATITFKAKKAGSSKIEWTSMKMLDKNLKDQVITPGQTTSFMKIFKDIAGHWAKDDIMQMVDKKIVEGLDSDRFSPNSNVTRAQFAALITRALDLKEGNGKNPFADVKSGAWYEDTVKRAYSAGIISGINSNKFAPDQSITREEMTTMLMRAKATAQGVKADDLQGGSSITFKDSSKISTWAQKSVGFAISSGLMKGRTATTFAPKEHATRAESAVVVKRLLSAGK